MWLSATATGRALMFGRDRMFLVFYQIELERMVWQFRHQTAGQRQWVKESLLAKIWLRRGRCRQLRSGTDASHLWYRLTDLAGSQRAGRSGIR